MKKDTATPYLDYTEFFRKFSDSTGLRKRLQQERRRKRLQLLIDILMVTASLSFLVATFLNLWLR